MNPLKTSPRALALGALFAALVTGATMLSIPVPGFRLYFNLGEGILYTVALLVGPRYGAVAGGLGAALGDILLGYPQWAPFSLVIKGLEGFVVGFLARRAPRWIALAAGALVMMGGYTSAAATLDGPAAAPLEALTDLTQTGIGAALAWILVPFLEKHLRKSR